MGLELAVESEDGEDFIVNLLSHPHNKQKRTVKKNGSSEELEVLHSTVDGLKGN